MLLRLFDPTSVLITSLNLLSPSILRVWPYIAVYKFSKKMPDITLYFLQASRSIRTAWLLEELGVDYRLEFSERENKVKAAPAAFKQSCGDALGKFPTLKDGDLTLGESGAITE